MNVGLILKISERVGRTYFARYFVCHYIMTYFPFDELIEPIKAICIEFLDLESKCNFRCVNRKYLSLISSNHVSFIVRVDSMKSIFGTNVNGSGYKTRVRMIDEHCKKSMSNF